MKGTSDKARAASRPRKSGRTGSRILGTRRCGAESLAGVVGMAHGAMPRDDVANEPGNARARRLDAVVAMLGRARALRGADSDGHGLGFLVPAIERHPKRRVRARLLRRRLAIGAQDDRAAVRVHFESPPFAVAVAHGVVGAAQQQAHPVAANVASDANTIRPWRHSAPASATGGLAAGVPSTTRCRSLKLGDGIGVALRRRVAPR